MAVIFTLHGEASAVNSSGAMSSRGGAKLCSAWMGEGARPHTGQ